MVPPAPHRAVRVVGPRLQLHRAWDLQRMDVGNWAARLLPGPAIDVPLGWHRCPTAGCCKVLCCDLPVRCLQYLTVT